jgi:hypothetical protein
MFWLRARYNDSRRLEMERLAALLGRCPKPRSISGKAMEDKGMVQAGAPMTVQDDERQGATAPAVLRLEVFTVL